MDLSREEIELLRQWYNAVQDLAPEYLEERDHTLASRIMIALGGDRVFLPAPESR
jgi:hypothetical protein